MEKLEMLKKYGWIMDALSKLPLSEKTRLVSNFLHAKKKYMPEREGNANVDYILKCGLCPNMCRFDCPVLQVIKTETVSPAVKSRLAYHLETGMLPPSEDLVKAIYDCCNCGSCQPWCPFDFIVGDLLKGVREDIAEMGKVPGHLLKFKELIEREHTIYEGGRKSLGRESGAKEHRTNRKRFVRASTGTVFGHDVLYFAGCKVINKRPQVAHATLKLMEKAGVRCVTLPEEWCCGVPLGNIGFKEEFKKFAEHTAKAIAESGAKTVVCSCPSCAVAFKELYPGAGVKVKADVMHSAEYLLGLVKSKKLKPGKLEGLFVYHDPCKLARKLEKADEPRELLASIGKLELAEPQFSGKETHCCGRGGSYATINPGVSGKITGNRLAELMEVSERIITACPNCELAFEGAASGGNGMEVSDIAEILLKSME